MISSEQLATKLKAARESAALTQAELARRAGLSLFTLAKLEQGKVSQPSFFTVLALVEQLEISLDELCELRTKTSDIAVDDAWQQVSWCFVAPSVLLTGWIDSIGVLAEQIGADGVRLENLFLKYREQLLLGQMTIYEFEQTIGKQFNIAPRKIGLRKIWFETLHVPPATLALLRQLYAADVRIGIVGRATKALFDDLLQHDTLPTFLADEKTWVLERDQPDEGALFEIAERTADKLPKQLLYIGDTPALVEQAASRNWQTQLVRRD